MANRRRKPAEAEAPADANAWMITFSDLLTLMLTFFVLIISMSSMDQRALKHTFGFFNDAVGVLDKAASAEVNQPSLAPIHAIVSSEVFSSLEGLQNKANGRAERLALLVERIIDENNLEHLLEARPSPGGIVITVAARLLFLDKDNRINPDARPILSALGDLLQNPNLHLRAEGRQLTSKSSEDPWEKAADRALAVVGHLLNEEKVHPKQLAVAGYGSGFDSESLPDEKEKVGLVLTWQRRPLKQ